MMAALGQQQTLAREEAAKSPNGFGDLLLGRMTEVANLQKHQLDTFSTQLQTLTESNGRQLELLRESVERRLLGLQTDAAQHHTSSREELAKSMTTLGEMLGGARDRDRHGQKAQLEQFQANVQALATTTEQKLDQMRVTVEGKAHATAGGQRRQAGTDACDGRRKAARHAGAAARRVVQDRQRAAGAGAQGSGRDAVAGNGVGDLKKVLSNIKTRGNWGEVQLGNLLEQMLTPDQYAANVQVNPASGDRVEFAIKLPGRDKQRPPCWLPIDAKFPAGGLPATGRRRRDRRRRSTGPLRRRAGGAYLRRGQEDSREVQSAPPTRRTLPSCSSRLRDCLPRCCVGPACATAFSTITASSSPVRRRWRRC